MATAKKAKKVSRASLMRQYYNGNPEATPKDVAKRFKTTYQVAYMVKRAMEPKKQGAGNFKRVALFSSNESVLDTINPECVKPEEPKVDPVNHPVHYKVGGIETIDFIEAKALSYHLGNAVKYITRADHKGNRLQDLQKAKWYIDRAIERANESRT
jgi:hypothetical protein